MFTGESGAVDHVIKKDKADLFPLRATEKGFTSASGGSIRNYGGRLLTWRTENKEGLKMSVQVTDAHNNVVSFPKMVEEGNDIMLSKKKG